MKNKYFLNSGKVKCISFHPNNYNLVLLALYDGNIQIWNFREKVLIQNFKGHEGAVRSLEFHKLQQIFVSSGDDALIKIFCYRTNTLKFVLSGHGDFVRKVTFHNELPWILSGSDDQTMRLWNWQSRNQVTLLAGHTHYIMNCEFHKKKDYIVSGSLDSTIRIWDFSKLKSKFTSANSTNFYAMSSDIDCIVVIDAHPRGVNYVSFHDTENLIISCSDDKTIKIWKYTNTSWYEKDTFHAHSANVSCVKFLPNSLKVISNGEEGSFRLFEKDGIVIYKHIQEDIKHWFLEIHPNNNLIASGTEKGCVIYNQNKEKMYKKFINKNILIYLDNINNNIKLVDLKTNNLKTFDIDLFQDGYIENNSIKNFIYNDFNNSKISFILNFKSNSAEYNNYFIIDKKNFEYKVKTLKEGNYKFISRDKILIFKNKSFWVLNLQNDKEISYDINFENINDIYQGSISKIILKFNNKLSYYDLTNKKIIGNFEHEELKKIKILQWNDDYSLLFIKTINFIFLLNKNFKLINVFKENSKIHSILFTNDNSIIFNTNNHLKYILINGDTGILKSIDKIIFLINLKDNNLIYSDSLYNFETYEIDLTEYELKLNLLKNDFKKIKKIIDNKKFKGKSIISFLKNKNYNSIALKLTKDPEALFYLNLNCGNLEDCYDLINDLEEKKFYKILAKECLKYGNTNLAKKCYDEIEKYEKLDMINLINGDLNEIFVNKDKEISVMNNYKKTIMNGNNIDKIKILASSGQISLAYAAAKRYGIKDYEETLKKTIPEIANNNDLDEYFKRRKTNKIPTIPKMKLDKSKYFENWPLQKISEKVEIFNINENIYKDEFFENQDNENIDFNFGNLNNEEEEKENNSEEEKKSENNIINDENWSVEEIDEILDNDSVNGEVEDIDTGTFIYKKDKFIKNIEENSLIISEQLLIGNYEFAVELLKKQIGVTKISSRLKKLIIEIVMSSQNYFNVFNFSNCNVNLIKKNDTLYNKINKDFINSTLKDAYNFFSKTNFEESYNLFIEIILYSFIFQAKDNDEIKFINNAKIISIKYILAIKANNEISKEKDKNKLVEKILIFASSDLEKKHHNILILQKYSISLYKMKNYIHAIWLIKKYLKIINDNELDVKKESIDKMKKILKACEKNGNNEISLENFEVQDLYDEDYYKKIDFVNIERLNDNTKYLKNKYLEGIHFSENGVKDNICPITNCIDWTLEIMGIKYN